MALAYPERREVGREVHLRMAILGDDVRHRSASAHHSTKRSASRWTALQCTMSRHCGRPIVDCLATPTGGCLSRPIRPAGQFLPRRLSSP